MSQRIPISVLVAVKNDGLNLPRCLQQVYAWADQVIIVDSFSTDNTVAIAKQFGAEVIQFEYKGGWPKKRQWAIDTYPFRNKWLLLLDADEILTPGIKNEITQAIRRDDISGYYLRYEILFLSKRLRFGDTALWKLWLFRLGEGKFERRLESQDDSMCDMEVHEHVIVNGRTAKLKHAIEHVNVNSLYRYIEKHNQYSNWESRVFLEGSADQLQPTLFGNQAQRRRFLKSAGMRSSLCPLFIFLYKYLVRFGWLDGKAGFYYCAFQAIQVLHVQAKIHEAKLAKTTVHNKTHIAENARIQCAE
ncbi:MAG: glycosyltransferase family 2 protein [Acidobacteriaceae bacterium]|nr:glycosyltransferase family 2 protein [Acidobacteriaceae bacterium]MBV9779055.1 glycosyltransferase family 2 protein [Acidobacteriaceae bacterium]